jgi:hypothetical protein
MTVDRHEVTRTIPADPTTIFAVLCDPQGHVSIDSSGMLMSASGKSAGAVGDTFEIQMHREALGDLPLGAYEVTVRITAFTPDREIAWTVLSPVADPPVGHIYGYSLRPVDGATEVTSYCDWSNIDPVWRDREIPGVGTVTWPVVPATTLRATLGILDRTVTRTR